MIAAFRISHLHATLQVLHLLLISDHQSETEIRRAVHTPTHTSASLMYSEFTACAIHQEIIMIGGKDSLKHLHEAMVLQSIP